MGFFNWHLHKKHRLHYGLLRDWYGDADFAATEVSAHVSKPVELSSEVEKLVSQLDTPENIELRRISDNWREFCGVTVAKMAVPASISDGILFVEVKHSLLLSELKPAMKLILPRINAGIKTPLCREIKLIIAGGGRRSG